MDKAKLIAICIFCTLLAACTGGVGNLCTAGPIIADPGANERWTRGEKEQVVGLNNAGRDICGWRSLSQ